MLILVNLMSAYIIMVRRELRCITSKWCFSAAGIVFVRGKKDWGDHAAAARVFAGVNHDIRQPQRGLRRQAEQGRSLLQQQAQCHFSDLAEQALWPYSGGPRHLPASLQHRPKALRQRYVKIPISNVQGIHLQSRAMVTLSENT